MKPIHFFLLIVTLPMIIVLGHDLYLFYVAQGEQLDPNLATKLFTEDRPSRGFSFAALGYIWTTYSPDTYKTLSESFEEQEWANIQQFLELKAFYVMAAFAAVMYALAGIVTIFKKAAASRTKVSKRKKAKMR